MLLQFFFKSVLRAVAFAKNRKKKNYYPQQRAGMKGQDERKRAGPVMVITFCTSLSQLLDHMISISLIRHLLVLNIIPQAL